MVHQIVHWVGLIGSTFSVKKLVLCVDRAEVVGHVCTYEGCIVDPAHVQCIQDWPECRSLMEVRAFFSMLGYVQIFIPWFTFLAWCSALCRSGCALATRFGCVCVCGEV